MKLESPSHMPYSDAQVPIKLASLFSSKAGIGKSCQEADFFDGISGECYLWVMIAIQSQTIVASELITGANIKYFLANMSQPTRWGNG